MLVEREHEDEDEGGGVLVLFCFGSMVLGG